MLREYRMTYYSNNRKDYEDLVLGKMNYYEYKIYLGFPNSELDITQIAQPVYADHLDSPYVDSKVVPYSFYADTELSDDDENLKILFPSKSFIEKDSTEFGSIVGNPKPVTSMIESIPIVVSSCQTMRIIKFSVTVVQNYMAIGTNSDGVMLYTAFKDILETFGSKLWRIEVKTQEGDFMPPDMPLMGFDSITNVEEYHDVGFTNEIYLKESKFGAARVTTRVNHTLLFKKQITGFNILNINIFVKRAQLLELERYALDKYGEEIASAFVNWFVPFGLNVIRDELDKPMGYYMMTPFVYMLVEV